MNKKVVAVVGSYRKGGIVDQAADEILNAASVRGGDCEKIYLVDKRIEFCTNCRRCTVDSIEKRRGECIFKDDMDGVLSRIDEADSIILGSPVNFGSATAIMKRFVERLIAYAYWPWGTAIPKERIKRRSKKAIVITSCGAPSIFGWFLMPGAVNTMKDAAGIMGAGTVKSLYFGMVSMEEKQRLNKKQLKSARSAARLLFD